MILHWIELDSNEEGEHFDLTEDDPEIKMEDLDEAPPPRVFTCSICLEDGEATDLEHYKTGCNHDYHRKCLNEWCKKKTWCPYCRTELSDDDKFCIIECFECSPEPTQPYQNTRAELQASLWGSSDDDSEGEDDSDWEEDK